MYYTDAYDHDLKCNFIYKLIFVVTKKDEKNYYFNYKCFVITGIVVV